jgi:DNA-binding GntR family transcriptional regulator
MAPIMTKKALARTSLMNAIRAGRYRPGQRLRQNDIARDLGLSSTPVREALTDLIGTGLVSYEEHRGVRVAEIDPERVRHVYQARKVIEHEAARLAFKGIDGALLARLRSLLHDMAAFRRAGQFDQLMLADEAFHLTILEASGNPYLVGAARHLWDGFPRYFIWLSEARMDQSMDEHAGMIDAVAAGDRKAFLAAVDEHLDHSMAAVLAYLEQTANEPEGHGDDR